MLGSTPARLSSGVGLTRASRHRSSSSSTVQTPFRRGDVDGDTKYNVIDAITIIQVAVGNLQPKIDCQKAHDANDDGQVTVADALPILAYVFQRGPALPDPFRTCGTDPTNDALTCVAYPSCQ